MKHKSTNKPAIPFHPLIDEQPADTLSHIQTMLRFAQESATKATIDTELTPYQTRIYSKLNGLLRMINEAVEYEMERLQDYRPEGNVKGDGTIKK